METEPAASESEDDLLRRLIAPKATYEVVRFFYLRLLGALYAVAFLVLVLQHRALLGSHGLLPAALYVERVTGMLGARGAFVQAPSIFFLIGASDGTLAFFAWAGLALSVA